MSAFYHSRVLLIALGLWLCGEAGHLGTAGLAGGADVTFWTQACAALFFAKIVPAF